MKAFEWTNPATVDEAVKMLYGHFVRLTLTKRHDQLPAVRIC